MKKSVSGKSRESERVFLAILVMCRGPLRLLKPISAIPVATADFRGDVIVESGRVSERKLVEDASRYIVSVY